jgi:tetratricopeptide (TPR) repeat protein
MRRLFPLTLCLLAATAAFAQQQKKAQNTAGPKTPAEQQAVQAVLQAQSPDDKIKAIDALVEKFPTTVYKSFALEQEAEMYQQKGDNAKAIVYGEQALMADPMSFDAENLLANVIAATTRDTDLDKAEKITRAEKYAHDSLDQIKVAAKPAIFGNMTDDQWTKAKKQAESLSWQALGNLALLDKKTDEAVADFQKGIDANPDPVLMIRTGRALLVAKKPDDAIVWFDKALAVPDAPAQIKSIAQSDKARALQAKGQK